MKKWAVVQNLMPFGYRIEMRTNFHFRAAKRASQSIYLEVMPLESALSENRRMLNDEEFDKELKNHPKYREA